MEFYETIFRQLKPLGEVFNGKCLEKGYSEGLVIIIIPVVAVNIQPTIIFVVQDRRAFNSQLIKSKSPSFQYS
ncbi:MAG: hypothetical protein PF542_04255 [Nanoarchaeota archaeon]|jgi:hypothetical protein|nr:hypothetical protein [Nanoarchaeota archaeon]